MKRIITTLASAQCTIDAALRSLLDEGKIERFRAMSVRRRLDEFWCLAGRAPHASIARYNAAEILAAFQLAASNQLGVK